MQGASVKCCPSWELPAVGRHCHCTGGGEHGGQANPFGSRKQWLLTEHAVGRRASFPPALRDPLGCALDSTGKEALPSAASPRQPAGLRQRGEKPASTSAGGRGMPLWLLCCQEFRLPPRPEVFHAFFLIAGTFPGTAFTLLIQLSVGVSFSLNFQIYTSPVSLASYLEVLMGA